LTHQGLYGLTRRVRKNGGRLGLLEPLLRSSVDRQVAQEHVEHCIGIQAFGALPPPFGGDGPAIGDRPAGFDPRTGPEVSEWPAGSVGDRVSQREVLREVRCFWGLHVPASFRAELPGTGSVRRLRDCGLSGTPGLPLQPLRCRSFSDASSANQGPTPATSSGGAATSTSSSTPAAASTATSCGVPSRRATATRMSAR
jgi:hypothetical protein